MAVVVLVEEKNKRRDLKDFELIKARSKGFKEHLIQMWGFRIRYVGLLRMTFLFPKQLVVMKERHMWAIDIKNILVQHASYYDFLDSGSKPQPGHQSSYHEIPKKSHLDSNLDNQTLQEDTPQETPSSSCSFTLSFSNTKQGIDVAKLLNAVTDSLVSLESSSQKNQTKKGHRGSWMQDSSTFMTLFIVLMCIYNQWMQDSSTFMTLFIIGFSAPQGCGKTTLVFALDYQVDVSSSHNLLAIPVGIKQKSNVDVIVQKDQGLEVISEGLDKLKDMTRDLNECNILDGFVTFLCAYLLFYPLLFELTSQFIGDTA
ncbi:uncharacterized protein LOC114304659 [Camellia sinensis]|uniref:uncharacterized protein LOC114304659 n=1 Tax=Camellia sinensis TaxID=4442 RepID=UPI001036442D|nr:uncharacterized protein LOC114304659 [Camellia sinensis]